MIKYLLACCLAIVCLITSAAQDDPWLILQKAAEAARTLSYKGVFVYQTANGAKAVQLTHMNFGQGEFARMIVLDGSPREVLKQGNDVVIFNPKQQKIVIEKRSGQNMFPAMLPQNLEDLKVSYQIKTIGMERVGGRDAQIVVLEPKDKYRYSYKFWADKEVGILLKVITANERNEPMEQVSFSQITMLDTFNMDWFHPQVDHAKPYVMEEPPVQPQPSQEGSDLGQKVVVQDQLPLGYKSVDKSLHMMPGKPFPVLQMIYSDGLASVSIFIEPLPKGSTAKIGHSSSGPANIYATVLDGHQIVVVGEVPELTVSQFANAISFKK